MPANDINALLQAWKEREANHGRGRFISDGIIDVSMWKQSKLKVLFLLKEAYYTSNWEEPLNLCQHIKKYIKVRGEPKFKIWHTVSQWAYGLQQLYLTGDVVQFPDKNEDRNVLKEALLSSSVINIKKCDGESTSDDSILLEYVTRDWDDYIFPQIGFVKPDIIICGATWWNVIKKYLDSDKQTYIKLSEWVYSYNNFIFIDFWHPANHYPNKLNYYSLCTAVRLSGVLGRKEQGSC